MYLPKRPSGRALRDVTHIDKILSSFGYYVHEKSAMLILFPAGSDYIDDLIQH